MDESIQIPKEDLKSRKQLVEESDSNTLHPSALAQLSYQTKKRQMEEDEKLARLIQDDEIAKDQIVQGNIDKRGDSAEAQHWPITE